MAELLVILSFLYFSIFYQQTLLLEADKNKCFKM